ncbi:MAG: hypothetical protein CR967_00955 [Proteobacteria bacterium]|nr:MAG: hypothetical protein CR967_00955 [Pseudomonadota bacterium]
MTLDFTNLSDLEKYKLMSTTISPRPIAWIVTEDEGIINIAPFSYFTPLSSNPPTLVVSIGQKDTSTPKDTLANILKHKKATICLAGKEFMDSISKSASPLPKNVSESKEFSIETLNIKDDYPPIVKGVNVAFFCDFYDTFPIEKSKTLPIFLTINSMFSQDEIIDENLHVKAQNIGRVGKSYICDYISKEQ